LQGENQICRRLKRFLASVLFATAAAFVLTIPLASRTTAQPSNIGQDAIRAALTKWMADFNAANVQEVCSLFSPDLRYDYRGFPERDYKDICDGLRRALTDRTKRYSYSLAIKEVLVSDDLAAVRLTWTLTVTKPDTPPKVSQERGIDVFKRQPDGTWKIVRFIAYDEPR
jgi:ketosteroid isomerase-like protein